MRFQGGKASIGLSLVASRVPYEYEHAQAGKFATMVEFKIMVA